MIETEIVSIINGFQDIDKNFKPEFAFIMINKKNSTRFFEYRDKNSTNLINPSSGSIISDDNI